MAEEIAIFPLSTVVLFPGIKTPLHLFEPRYRQMCEDALAHGRCIGMVVVPPEHVDEMPGNPPVYPVGCAGAIVRHHRRADGRHDIVLEGLHRFRIASEAPPSDSRLYRLARVEPLEDRFPAEERERVRALRGRIVDRVASLVRRSDPERAGEITHELFAGIDDVTFVNALCNAFAFPPPEKQGLLEADGVPERFERLEGLLAFREAELEAGAPPGAGSVH